MRQIVAIATLGLVACAESTRPEQPAEPLPPVHAETRVDEAVVTTGDVITYEVIVEYDDGYEVDVPEVGTQIAGLRVIDLGRDPPKRERGRTQERRWYQLRADLVGSYVLPPLKLRYRKVAQAGGSAGEEAGGDAGDEPGGAAGEKAAGSAGDEPGGAAGEKAAGSAGDEPGGAAGEKAAGSAGDEPGGAAGEKAAGSAEEGEAAILETSEIFVEVESVLPQDGEVRDIRDLKVLRRKSFGPPAWLVAGGVLGLLLAVAVIVVLLRRRKMSVELAPPPPHELAYAALDDLRGTDFSDPVALRKYYFAISDVIRAYVKGRFGINATELTTEEIVPQIAAIGELAPADQMRLREFLTETDLVKFAAQRPTDAQVEGTYEKALTFIEATIPAPEPEAEATAA